MRLLEWIDATAAAGLAENGAILVDVREDGEFARQRIPGSVHMPLSRLGLHPLPGAADQPVIFLCASGGRTAAAESRLATLAGTRRAYVLAGGIVGWQGTGLPVESGAAGGTARPGPRTLFARLFGT